MTLAMIVVAAIFVTAVVLFVTEVLPIDLTALLTAAALMLTGVLTPAEGLSGFSNPATITIASMLVLSAGLEQTGALRVVIDGIERVARRRRRLGVFVLFLVIGVLSGFVNNTAIVALFIPILMELAPRLGTSPSKLLMPLSFIALLGGVCTLIGTSTNLLVSTISVEHGGTPLGMFELLPVGGVLFAAGLLYMLTIGARLIPARRRATELTASFDLQPWLTDVELGPASRAVGEPLAPGARLDPRLDIDVVEALRDGRAVRPGALLRNRDVLRVRGSAGDLATLARGDDVRLGTARAWRDADLASASGHLVEAVLPSRSELVGKRIAEIDFPSRYGAVALAVRQRGELRREAIGEIAMRGGDTVLLHVEAEHIDRLRTDPAMILASELVPVDVRRAQAPLAVAVMIGVVLAATFGFVPIVVAATTGVLVMVLGGCLRMEQIYRAINWRVIMLLAGVIPLGVALERTGLATLLVEGFVHRIDGLDPHLIVAGVFLVTLGITSVLSNVATAALLAPLVLQLAATLGIDGRGLLITVTFGASMSFLSPIGYQSNTLIYGPGQYRFVDFLRVGAPLCLICCAIVTALVPIVWPLRAP